MIAYPFVAAGLLALILASAWVLWRKRRRPIIDPTDPYYWPPYLAKPNRATWLTQARIDERHKP